MKQEPSKLQTGDALLIVDVQNDFLPLGLLAVPYGDEVVPPLNEAISKFRQNGQPIYVSRDWHPDNHCSFEEQNGKWPVHCVKNTDGAAFPSTLKIPKEAVIISKGTFPTREAYSAFEGTDLLTQLKEAKIQRLYIGGLATDYCVLQTVLDALNHGFSVFLMQDTIRAVNVEPDDGEKAISQMLSQGARLINSDAVV
jgi:nicotinamidase/pyrazinamidase